MARPRELLSPPGLMTPEEERQARATKMWESTIKDWKGYKKNEAMLLELERKIGDKEALASEAYDALETHHTQPVIDKMSDEQLGPLMQQTRDLIAKDYENRVVALRRGLQKYLDITGTDKPPEVFFQPPPKVPPTGEIRQHDQKMHDIRESHGRSAVDTALHALGVPAKAVSGGLGGALATFQEHTDVPPPPDPKLQQELAEYRTRDPRMYPPPVKAPGKISFGGVDWEQGAEKLFSGELPIGELISNVVSYARGNVEVMGTKHYQSLSSVLAEGAERYREKAKNIVAEKFADGEIEEREVESTYKKLLESYVEADPATKNPEVSQMMLEIVADPLWVITPAAVYKQLKKVPTLKQAINLAEKGVHKATEHVRFMGGQIDELRRAGHKDLVAELELAKLQSMELSKEISRTMQKEIDTIKKVDKGDIELLYEVRTGQTPMSEALYKFRQMGKAGKKRQELFEDAYEAAGRLSEQHTLHGKASGVRMRREGEKLIERPDLPDYVPGREKLKVEGEAAGVGVGPLEGRETITASSAMERTLPAKAFTPDVAKQWTLEKQEWIKKVEAAYQMRKSKAVLARHGFVIEVDNPAKILEQAGVATTRGGVKTKILGAEDIAAKKMGEAPEKFTKMLQKEQKLVDDIKAQEARINEITDAFRKSPEGAAGAAKEALGAARQKLQTSQDELVKLRAGRQKYVATLEMQEETIKSAKAARAALDDTLQKMKKDTGVEWDFMEADDRLHEIYTRVTGMPLTVETGQKLHLMPKDAINTITALTPFWAKEQKGAQSASKAIEWALNKTLRPMNQVFRTAVTTAFPMYHVRNFQTNVMLNAVGLGFKAANPKLQGTTARLALLAGGLNSKKALSMSYKLPSGETVKMSDLLKMAKEDGVVAQFDVLTQQRGSAIQKLAGLEFAPEAIQKVSPKAVGNLGENYSKLLAYIGSLEGTSQTHRARAVKFMGDFVGDYRKMGDLEKSIMTEIVPFYGWARFIVPYTARRIADSPAKMGVFAKTFEANKERFSKLFPVDPATRDQTAEDLGTILPMAQNSRAVKEYQKTGKLPTPGSDEYFIEVSENPLTAGLVWVSQFESLFGKPGTREARDRLVMNLGPLIVTMFEIGTGRDFRTGESISDFVGDPSKIVSTDPLERTEGIASVQTSHTGRLMGTLVGRGVSTYHKVQELLIEMGKPEEAINMAVLWAARNQMVGLENLIIGGKYGMEGLRKALPILPGIGDDPLGAPLPGSSVRVGRPHEHEAYRRREASRQMESTIHQTQELIGPGRRPVAPLETLED